MLNCSARGRLGSRFAEEIAEVNSEVNKMMEC